MFEQAKSDKLFSGLRHLGESAFPKRCRNCGREYASAAEFVGTTQALRPNCSGLKHSFDDDGNPIVDLFRNCACGSTLMQSFDDRRDSSQAGVGRRRRFERVLGQLVAQGLAREIAYTELVKLVRGCGRPSDLLRLITLLDFCAAKIEFPLR